jgi:hypothetical protein
MDNAKFCLATQGWSTPEFIGPLALLRRRRLTKQEEDHALASCATRLLGWPCTGGRINGLTVVMRKPRIQPGFG